MRLRPVLEPSRRHRQVQEDHEKVRQQELLPRQRPKANTSSDVVQPCTSLRSWCGGQLSSRPSIRGKYPALTTFARRATAELEYHRHTVNDLSSMLYDVASHPCSFSYISDEHTSPPSPRSRAGP